MKPILYILFMRNQRLDNLSVLDYKIIRGSDILWALSPETELIKDLREDGIQVQVLPPDAAVFNNGAAFKQGVLFLPGSSIQHHEDAANLIHSLEIAADVRYMGQESAWTKLLDIMALLRSDKGCPWDKEQDHITLKKCLIEEAYEVIDAIDSKNMNNLCEELGDLLLQVVFHARIAEEARVFTMSDVIKGISEKLIRRHPHVFGSITAKTSQEVILNWEAIKKTEKNATQSERTAGNEDFFRLPKGLPALILAEEVQKKAGKVGFDWDAVDGPLTKIYEELAELEKEMDSGDRQQEELGDLLFSIVNLSRFLGINAEEALRIGTQKFQKRFNVMLKLMAESGMKMEGMSIKEMDFYWDKAKKEEKNGTLGSN